MKLYSDYLEAKLKAAGAKGQCFKTFREMEASKATYLSAVLFEKQKFEKADRSFRFIKDTSIVMRRVVLDKYTLMTVIIAGSREDELEIITKKFEESLETYIPDSENCLVKIRLVETDWIREKESVLVSKIAAQYVIEFVSGVYKDRPLKGLVAGDITVGGPNG